MTADFLKEDKKKTQKFLDERLFNRTPEDYANFQVEKFPLVGANKHTNTT